MSVFPLKDRQTTTLDDRLEKGVEAQVEIFGEQMKDAFKTGHINRWLAANCFGDYYTRKGLTLSERELITFCFLMAQGGCEPQLVAHAKGNMNVGNDQVFLMKVISQCLPYIGYPRSLKCHSLCESGGGRVKPKAVLKLAVDGLMTILILFLMGYQLWGEVLHEWAGAAALVLFIIHHGLNRGFYKTLFQGSYSVMCVITLCIDCLVLIVMLMQMYSGIVMSRYVFAFLPFGGGMALVRRLHILGAYWGFLLISVHLGLHWNMMLSIIRKIIKIKSGSNIRSTITFLAGLAIAGYGVWVFINRNFFSYLFMQTEFVFLDYSEPAMLFYIDYLALMGLCIFIAHYAQKCCGK